MSEIDFFHQKYPELLLMLFRDFSQVIDFAHFWHRGIFNAAEEESGVSFQIFENLRALSGRVTLKWRNFAT